MAGTASDDRAAQVRSLKCFLYTEYRDRTDTSAPERTTDNLSYRQPGALSLPYLATGAEYHCNVPECFSQLILAIRQCIHISLMTERWYPSLEPCRLIYYSGSWYLIALQKGKLQVFPLADIKSVSLTSERFERRGHIHSLVAEERFISALPHFSFIHKLINTFNL